MKHNLNKAIGISAIALMMCCLTPIVAIEGATLFGSTETAFPNRQVEMTRTYLREGMPERYTIFKAGCNIVSRPDAPSIFLGQVEVVGEVHRVIIAQTIVSFRGAWVLCQ